MMRMVKSKAASIGLVVSALSLAAVVSTMSVAQDQPDAAATTLRAASEFEPIADNAERSRALFEEAGKVIQHPRCVNCHPAGDQPLQGMEMRVHEPPVSRGEGDLGMPGMMCGTCHGAANVEVVGQAETIKSIPGHPLWHVAPIEMAWVGKTLGEICQQLKDPARNGGKTVDQIVDHMAEDSLVGWGWEPGAGREPVPGSQQVFGELIRRWAETGADCPAP
ncbi:Isoquinoline 1-oxidoreductase subunit [Mesorhizobium sp. M1322]|uniref:Isoquinoline 1-oxidoreductase subunit n=1 Tax=Mesorhizobium sp. M1322 TaxID=2957081 RepID=UPI0033367EDA